MSGIDPRDARHARAIVNIREVKLDLGEDNYNYPKLDDVENHLFQSNAAEEIASTAIQLIQNQNRQLKEEVSKIPPLKSLNHQLLTKLHQQSAENAAFNDRLAQLEGRLSSQITTLKGQIVTQNGQITILKGHNATMNGEIATLKDQIVTQDGQITTLKGQNATMNGEIATLKGEITTLKGQNATQNGEIATLNAQNENFSCGIATLTAANRDLNVDLSSIQRRFRIGQYLIAIRDAQTFLTLIGCNESKNRLSELRQSFDWINYERVLFCHYIVTDEGSGKKMYKVKVLLDKLGAMNDDEKVELNGMLGGENILSLTTLLSEIYVSEVVHTLPEDCPISWCV
jgi:chromosome segregation ATPase